MAKNLKVKAIILDIRYLLDKRINNHTSDPVKATVTPVKKVVKYDLSEEITNITSIQAKYMKKIKDKGLTSHDISSARGGAMSDGQIYTKLKSQNFDSDATSSILTSDMTNMINYAHGRGLQIVLFGHNHNNSHLLEDSIDDSILMEQICKEFNKEVKISHHFIMNTNTNENMIDKDRDIQSKSNSKSQANINILTSLESMEGVVNVSPGSFMLVTSDVGIINAGSRKGYHVMKYRYRGEYVYV